LMGRMGRMGRMGLMGFMVGALFCLQSSAFSLQSSALRLQKPVAVYAPVKDEVEVKEVRRGQTARFEFTIRNQGTAPLRIEVKPNCNCTVPGYDRVIAPKKLGKVTAELSTLDLSGYTTKTLLVTTNDPKRPKAGLYMITTVVSMVEVTPSERIVMRMTEDGPTAQELTLKLRKGETAEITAARTNMRVISPKLEPIEMADPKYARAYKLTLTALPITPYGRTQARITLATTSEAEPEVRLHVICERGIVAMPSNVHLGVVPPKPPKPIERKVTLSKHGVPFYVRSVTCDDPTVKLSYSTVRAGSNYRISVRWLGGWEPGWVQRRIVVETNDAHQPQVVIPLMARVVPKP